MQRLLGLGIGTWVVLVLLATVLFQGVPVAQAMVPDEAVVAQGFDCADVTQIPQVECEALVTFFYATGGDGWYYDDGWLVTNTPCDWYGITCDAGHVTGLDMGYDTNLVGSIPPELADLAQLKVLLLWGSELNGVIPPELGTLSQLQTFRLGYSPQLNMPPELGNLSSLQTLEIRASQIPADPSEQLYYGCAIPPEVGNLANLQYLSITYSLCGTIPAELGNLSNLQVLDLSSNYALKGNIPPELGNLSNLTHLDLSGLGLNCDGFPPFHGQMTGPLPPELGNLTNLQVLDLECQSFSGPMPMSFINLLQLDTLDYGWTSLCEPPDPAFQDWIAGVPNVYPSPGVICVPTSQQLCLPLVVR